MHEFHLVCSVCGTLLECDNLDISLDEDDICEVRPGDDRHVIKEVKCTCLVTLRGKG